MRQQLPLVNSHRAQVKYGCKIEDAESDVALTEIMIKYEHEEILV